MRRLVFLAISLCSLGACGGIQSSLAPAGAPADWIATLYWWMAAGAVVIWIGVIALGWYYGRPHAEAPNARRDRLLIVGAGVALPVVVLTVLLTYGLAMIPPLVARAPEGSLLVRVTGEQWWWRVEYVTAAGVIETANEIRLPVNAPVQFELASDDVIHSFWVPPLGGKMDMIPGRVTYLALHPTQTGVFAGACAEYCGTSHAFMRVMVEVMEAPAFERWLAEQARPAVEPQDALAQRGRSHLLSSGCGACHQVRGTAARGRIAPELTHVAGRLTLGAGTLPTTTAAFRRWIAGAHAVKPGVSMPPFSALPNQTLDEIAAYLSVLR